MAVAQLVREWLLKYNWEGEPNFDELSFWIHPSNWQQEAGEPLARFYFCTRPGTETKSYRIADLCGVGETDWGFKFEVTHSWFGGRSSWATMFKGMAGLADELVKKGWINVGKGVFFRPVKLPPDLLAGAWESEDWSALLSPLKRAFDALMADQAAFDEIIMAAKREAREAAA
jgi:hypothetical protein